MAKRQSPTRILLSADRRATLLEALKHYYAETYEREP